MVKYREILRLTTLGVSRRNVAWSIGCSLTTVQNVLTRAKVAGIAWPLPQEMTDAEIYKLLYPPKNKEDAGKSPIDHEHVARELKRRGVTMTLLWTEYCDAAHSRGEDPYLYSAFCARHRKWAKENGFSMHIEHVCGQQMQVDWVGDTCRICDPATGEVLKAYVFVATLPWSGYTFAEAFLRMDAEAWVNAHVHAFEFFGGVTPIVVPDNCKTAITKNTREQLIVNDEYRRLAEHYGFAVVPARVRKPRDKAHVEMTVGVIERQVLAPMRDMRFFGIAALNRAIIQRVDELNAMEFQKKQGSRKSAYLGQEKSALIPLPQSPYEYVIRKQATVNFNYHVAFEGCWYSVPFSYVRREVEVAASSGCVSVLCDGKRIAMHARLVGKGSYSTNPEHMPQTHRDFAEWDSDRFRGWAAQIGIATEDVVDRLLKSRPIEQQAYRSCRALLGLSKKYGKDILEEACSKALLYSRSPSYKTVKQLAVALAEEAQTPDPDEHAYLRGNNYYKSLEQGKDATDGGNKEDE